MIRSHILFGGFTDQLYLLLNACSTLRNVSISSGISLPDSLYQAIFSLAISVRDKGQSKTALLGQHLLHPMV